MTKTTKWILGGMVVTAIAFTIAWFVTNETDDKASPSATASYHSEQIDIKVIYNQPKKRGRQIFGALVPFNQVWRTGANEATVFETKTDINIAHQPLTAGKYTLWTIPGEKEWQVIFNSKMYPWGVDFNEQALREPKYDALVFTVPVTHLKEEVEQFTIQFNDNDSLRIKLSWDKTQIEFPISL